MTNENLVIIAKHVAIEILKEALTTGHGSYSSEFGPVVYNLLVKLATNGDPKEYCDRESHIFNIIDRCVICNQIKI